MGGEGGAGGESRMGRGGLRGLQALVAAHASKADGAVSVTPAFMAELVAAVEGMRDGKRPVVEASASGGLLGWRWLDALIKGAVGAGPGVWGGRVCGGVY